MSTAPMAAYVESDGTLRQIKSEPVRRERLEPSDVEDSSKLAALLNRMQEDLRVALAGMRRPFIDFEDVAITSGNTVQLRHQFNGKVRWYVINWKTSATSNTPLEDWAALTDADTLGLYALETGTVSIRVEPAY